jgi:hypothetical protein
VSGRALASVCLPIVPQCGNMGAYFILVANYKRYALSVHRTFRNTIASGITHPSLILTSPYRFRGKRFEFRITITEISIYLYNMFLATSWTLHVGCLYNKLWLTYPIQFLHIPTGFPDLFRVMVSITTFLSLLRSQSLTTDGTD